MYPFSRPGGSLRLMEATSDSEGVFLFPGKFSLVGICAFFSLGLPKESFSEVSLVELRQP